MTKLIPLHNRKGEVIKNVVIDDADFDHVSTLRWTFALRDVTGPDGGYATHIYINEAGKQRTIYMHRFILNAPNGVNVDHKNGRTLDNTRANLRFATCLQNQQNQAKTRVTCTSKYKGVNLVPMKGRRTKGHERWRANINVNGKRVHLGYFPSDVEAARAYDQAAILHFDEFARLNFPTV